jgi:hypothetical protein
MTRGHHIVLRTRCEVAFTSGRPGEGGADPKRVSHPYELRVLRLEPIFSARAALVEAVRPLRHDPREAHFAGLGEDERALCLDRLAEQDGVGAVA